ncbi:MAG: hypothetical protein U0K91_09995 [Acutalibacteraceae bacterium]|nr:hypothetical protein [Acutalibacteraceae bacterium]
MILSKIKTLIEYAKFGICISRYVNGETVIDELFCPRSITTYSTEKIGNFTVKCKKLSGYIKKINGAYMFQNYRDLVELDLPYCTSFTADSTWGTTNNGTNQKVKSIKLPSLRVVNRRVFWGLASLEYLELGALTSVDTYALGGASSLTDLYVKAPVTCSLFLYESPNLKQECLHKIIENYADMTGATAPTFHVGGANMMKIDKEHIAMLESKNIFYQ